MRVYVTMQGDKWDQIAFQQYGDTRYMAQLMATNPHLLPYYIFPADIAMWIPEITQEQAALSELPPWRREV